MSAQIWFSVASIIVGMMCLYALHKAKREWSDDAPPYPGIYRTQFYRRDILITENKEWSGSAWITDRGQLSNFQRRQWKYVEDES